MSLTDPVSYTHLDVYKRQATDSAGKQTTVVRHVKLDTGAPVFQEITITPNPVDAGKTYIISVKVVDA